MEKIKVIKQAVILAGGQGIRLRPFTNDRPKPMILINNRPFAEYLIDILKENGIKEVVFLLGYLPEKIIEHFGDGSKFGLKIKYSVGSVEDETGTRIRNTGDLLQDDFLLMYCDNYWSLDIVSLVNFRNTHNSLVAMTVYGNKDGITKNNVFVNAEGYIEKYDRSRKTSNLNGVEIGFSIVSKRILELMPTGNFSYEDVIIPQLITKHELSGYITNHRYFSIGNIERLPLTEKFLKPKKVIFLDRDGVINKKPPKADYVKSWQEFGFLPGAIEALKLLSKNGYEIYIISNQAGIARGMMAESDLKNIHDKMKKELEKNNITLSGIYYCPHGWDDNCGCRKPNPGMFFQVARDHFVDLTKAIFIGDDKRDLEAGKAARCKTLLVEPDKSLLQIVKTLIKI